MANYADYFDQFIRILQNREARKSQEAQRAQAVSEVEPGTGQASQPVPPDVGGGPPPPTQTQQTLDDLQKYGQYAQLAQSFAQDFQGPQLSPGPLPQARPGPALQPSTLQFMTGNSRPDFEKLLMMLSTAGR